MNRLLIYMVCVWLLSGCSPDSSPGLSSSGAIRFVSGISVEETKAAGAVASAMLPPDSRIGLYAVSQKTEGGAGGSEAQIVMNNLEGTVGAEGAIDYNPVKYYEAGRSYTFYACYPYMASLDYTNTGQAPSIPFSPAAYAVGQEDLMWASLSGVTYTPGARKFTFRHALSRIRLRIWNGSAAEVALDGIHLKAPASGVLSLDGEWTEIEETQPKAFGSFTLFHPAEPVMLPKEAFYEVPASLLQLPVGEKLMLSQTFTVGIGGKTYEIHPSTPSGGWKSGVSYLYTIWYDTDGVGFKGTVEPWDPVEVGDAPVEEQT